jgi:hypothetical protein
MEGSYRPLKLYFIFTQMNRLLDFNLSTPRSKTQSSNESSIVINNTVNNDRLKVAERKKEFPQQIQYPPLDVDAPSVAPVFEREVQPQPVSDPTAEEIAELKAQIEYYQELARTFSKILKNNNTKLIANLIDQSGKIILDAESLCLLIGLITASDPSTVNIQYESNDETGCLAKINLIHKVKSIKIGVIDFNLGFNAQYNTLQEKFAVSLKRVLISL